MTRLLRAVLVVAAIFPATTQGQTTVFVRALDYDANTQFREPHEAACTRAGLLATPPLVLLSSTPSAPLLWGAAAAASAVAQLGDAQLSVPPVSGCCSNSMYCWRNAAGSARPYTCGIHGAGSLTFSNTGWTANSSLTPVFACVGPMPSPSALPAFAARLPVAGAARFVTDPLSYAGVRLRIDGVNLSTQWPQATQVYVGGVSCRDVEPCHFECGSCSSDADCGRDTVCERFGSVSYCLRRCDWPSATSFTCPCGGRCYSVTFPGRTPSTFCLNPSFDLNNMSTLCTGANEFTPALSSGWNQRLECTPSWPIISPGHSTPVAPPPWYPFAPGPGLTSVVLTTSASGAAGGGRLRARRRALWQHSTTLTTAADHPSETEKQDEEGGALKLLPGDANPRSLLSTAATTTTTTTTLMGGATPLSGYRYGGVCNATSALLLSVIVVRNGLASTGLGVAAGASAGLVPNASTFVPPGSPFFTALGYMGGVPALPAPGLQCVRDADCGAVDGCSVPRCLAWSPTTNSTVAGNASIPGCCVYLPSGACDSGDFAPAEVLYTPASVNYVPLPREVAAAVAIPPPPVGGMNDQNPSASNKLAASDMSIRDPTINPTAFSWDAASVWYSNPAAVGPSGSAHVFAPYVLSPYASSDDNGPPDVVNLGLNVTLWGVTSSVLRVSPNGYFRNAPTDALVCADGFGSPPPLTCDYFNDYEGILGPLVYNFNPGFYGDAFTYVGAWDASAEAQISTGAPLSSAAVACAVWLNTGLNVQPASPFPPPNPSYSFMGCVHGDGGVRWRYGQVLGVPGYVVGAWGPTDTVSSYGGPPNVTLPGDRWSPGWLAGVRSASSSAAAAETDYVHDLPPLLDSPPPSPGALSDIAQRSNAQVTLSRSGVRQGATAAACQISPIACAMPACGGTGTVVTLTWGGIGCGLGFDALGVPGATTAVSLPRVECVFGGVPTLAVLVRAAATAGGSGGGGAGVWACTAPDRSSFNGTYGTTSAFTVPLRLQLIAPTEPAGYAPLLRPSTVYAPFGVPDPSSGIGDEAVVAFARGAAGGGPNSASALVPLDVYGVGVAPSCNGSSSSSTGGGVSSSACSVAPPSPPSATTTTTSTTFLLPREMSFSYGATGPGGALTCGCSASSPAAVCDACGVCGGSGSFTDCAGVCFGTAFIDACGNCSGGSTGTIPDAAKDCDGVCGGRNWACAVAAQSSSSAADSQEVTLNIIVISALITCSVALVIMIVYFAWMAILRHRHERDAILEFLTLEDLGIPPGLSEASRSALPIVSYHPKTAECADIGEHDTCSICMDKYAEGEPVRLLPTCKHAFHVACLDKWLERATQCPVCRAELRSDAERAEVEAAQERLRYRGTRTHHHHPAAGGAGGAGAPRVTLTVQMGPTMTRPVRVQPSPRRSQSPLSARSTGGGAVTSAAAPVAVDGSSSTQQQRNTHPPLPTPGLRPAPAAGSTGVSASSVHVEGVDAGGSGGSAYASVSDAGGPSRASRAGEGGAAAGNRAMRRARSSGGGHGSGSGSGTGLPREDSSSSNSSSSTTSNGGGGGGVDGTSSASDGRGRRGGGGGGGPNRNRRENESPTSAAAGASASSPARRAASATGSGSSFSSPNRAGGGGAGPSSPPGMSNRSSFISGRRIMHSMDDGDVDGNDDDGDVARGGGAAAATAADGGYYDVSGSGVGVGVGSQHPPRREGGGGGARRAGGAPLSQQQLLLQQQRQSPNIELASSSHAAYAGGGGGGNSSNNSLGSSGGVNGGGSGGSIGSNGSPSATRPPRAISAHTTTPNSRSVLSSNAPKDAYSSPHGGPYTAWIDETGTLIALDNPLHSSRSRNVASTHSAMSLPGSAPHSR